MFYRAGLYYPIASKLELSGDLGYFHIENFENEDAETPERMYSLQARINLEYKFKSRISFFASGGYGMTRYYDKISSTKKTYFRSRCYLVLSSPVTLV